MSFILLFQFLGTHIPELGAFLVTLLFVGVMCFAFYKWGYHVCGKAWKLQVKQMPRVIEQSIVEEYELTIARKDERIKWLEERQEAIVPALRGMASLAERAARDE